MFSQLSKVIRDQRDLLLFRSIRPDLAANGRWYFFYGLFITFLAGIGRYWDNPKANILQYLGIGSAVYVFILSFFIWIFVVPLRTRNLSYFSILIFVMMTSFPALLYAIPVEKFMSMSSAARVNALFLLVVAMWRVALLFKFMRGAAGLHPFVVLVTALLPLTLIVTVLTVLNLEQAAFSIMAGIVEPTPYDGSFGILVFITVTSVFASPFLFIAWLIMIFSAHRKRRRAMN